MKLPLVDTAGKELRKIDAADDVFGIEPNRSVLHQAYVAQMSNRRAGTASTKSRGEVRGSTVKIRKQKGLGRSRQGSIRASHQVGGGVAFGPKPHPFTRDLPRQMKRLALRSALSSHAANGSLTVVEGLSTPDAKTRALRAVLAALGIERRALLVMGSHTPELTRAAHNISDLTALPAQNLNVVELINAHRVVMTEDAVRACEALWGGENLKLRRGRAKEAAV